MALDWLLSCSQARKEKALADNPFQKVCGATVMAPLLQRGMKHCVQFPLISPSLNAVLDCRQGDQRQWQAAAISWSTQ